MVDKKKSNRSDAVELVDMTLSDLKKLSAVMVRLKILAELLALKLMIE